MKHSYIKIRHCWYKKDAIVGVYVSTLPEYFICTNGTRGDYTMESYFLVLTVVGFEKKITLYPIISKGTREEIEKSREKFEKEIILIVNQLGFNITKISELK